MPNQRKAVRTISVIVLDRDRPGQFLAVKRRPGKRYHSGKWNIISGKFEGSESFEGCVRREIREELGLTHCKVVEAKRMRPYREIDGHVWLVTPAKCYVSGEIVLDGENTEFRWVTLEEFMALDCAPPAIDDLHDFFFF